MLFNHFTSNLLKLVNLRTKISLIHLYLMVLICLNSNNLYSQCLFENSEGPTFYPGCALGTPKCLKIKFHFINNTSNPMNSPTDAEFRNLISLINDIYSPAGISFSTDNECIHRTTIVGASPLNIRAGLGIPPNDPQYSQYVIPEDVEPFKYKNNFINIYMYQANNEGGTTHRSNHFRFCRSANDPNVLAHEIGHALSLNHTSIGQDYLNPSTWECIGGDATKSDQMPDTEADPSGMDIDHDNLKDNEKWYNGNCGSVSAINNYVDNCGSNAWKPPYKNFMHGGNTSGCWNHFSPCQFSAMHFEIDQKLQNYLGDCNSGGGQNSCQGNITITVPTIWTNTVVEMCPHSKIIISGSGSLQLINTKITKKIINSSCPDLDANWDGIYISSGGSTFSFPGNAPPPNGGFINVTANSIIEYSDNGIQAPLSHNGISIVNSTMRENGMAINAKGPGGFVYSGGVIITGGSQISNALVGSKPVMILLNGTNLNMQASILTNYGGANITGVKSFNAGVSIKSESKIIGFAVGVDKEIDGSPLGLGLTIENSKIYNGYRSIRNTSTSVSAKFNYLGGYVENFGKAYGKWFANNFRKSVTLDNPTFSHTFQENNFSNASLDFNKNQNLTDAHCNIWDNSDDAIKGQASIIKSSWGSQTVPSGNKWIGNQPVMDVNQCNPISNWQQPSNNSTIFYYSGQFMDNQNAIGLPNCNYTLFPISFVSGGGGSSETFNDNTNRSLWESYNNQFQTALQAIPNATPEQLPELIRQKEDAEVGMGQCVLSALENFNIEMSQSMYNYWISKTDPLFLQRMEMITLFNSNSFSNLSFYLSSLNLTGVENGDRNIMITASNWLATAIGNNVNIYSLQESDLNYLIGIASSSFESYTPLLRAFLNIYYNIRIDPPQPLNQYSRHSKSNIDNEMVDYLIFPNPTNGDIIIQRNGNKDALLEISVFSISGKNLFTTTCANSESLTIKDMLSPGVYILKIKDQYSIKAIQKKLIIF